MNTEYGYILQLVTNTRRTGNVLGKDELLSQLVEFYSSKLNNCRIQNASYDKVSDILGWMLNMDTYHSQLQAAGAVLVTTWSWSNAGDTTGFGSNVYSGFGLRCKTSLYFEDNFALWLSHNQSRYNLNHDSNSPCDLLLHHAIPWSRSASTFQLYVPHQTLLQV